MNKHKVKAFTIMEITVAMLLAAIVIGITYAAYSIISQSYMAYHNKNEDMEGLVRLDELLRRDFSHADTISKVENGILCKIDTESISYEFQPDYVVRHSTIIDTFKLKTSGINTLFENQPVAEINSMAEQNRLDELDLTVLFHDEKIPYYYHKQYSSANLAERNPNALN
jgi:type II secretory pathway component PulJ